MPDPIMYPTKTAALNAARQRQPAFEQALYVELRSSENPYIQHPAKGLLYVWEYSVDGHIISATFAQLHEVWVDKYERHYYCSAFVDVKNPSFIYRPRKPE